MSQKRILVAMSGGVDSSVAAALCCEAGHEVIGVSMKLYDADLPGPPEGCCSADDFDDARAVARKLDFPHYVVNLMERFANEVIANFITEYVAGRTPNPCILCNDALKFEALRAKAVELECDAMATGHYARIAQRRDRFALLAGLDATRDQSYFLFTLTQKQMPQVLFPVGELTKTQVRSKAAALGLAVSEKPESREICFVPNDDYAAFLEKRAPQAILPGQIVDREEKVLGEHQGIHRFTIGQRRGLGIAHSEPLYVVALDPVHARVVVGTVKDLESGGLIAHRMNWIEGAPPATGTEALVKIRYYHAGVRAWLEPEENDTCRIRFSEPLRAVAPGQAAVAYNGDRVIGGGWIERALP